MKSDSQLQQDVLAELRWEPAVNAAHVGVEVTQGVVTLRGYVASCSEQWDAQRAAQRVAGVQGLVDEVTVELAAGHSRPDSDILSAARNVLQWTTSLPRDTIRVASWSERALARQPVWGTPGVRSVVDRMTVTA